MADYDLLASEPTVQVLSPTLVNDVVYCTIQTTPSGVIASIPVQQDVFNLGTAGVELFNFADAIEQIMAINYVIAGVGTQQIDNAGLLQDFVTFTIGYPKEHAEGSTVTVSADIPVDTLNFSDAEIGRVALQNVENILNLAYDNLAAAARG